MAIALILAELRRGDREHRAQTLSAAIDQVVRELGDHFDIGNGLVENDAIDRFHILGNDLKQRLYRLRTIAGIFKRNNATQWYPQINIIMLSIQGAQGRVTDGLEFAPLYLKKHRCAS